MDIKRTVLVSLTVLAIIVVSCNKEKTEMDAKPAEVKQPNPMDDFAWLLGKWQNYDGIRTTFEIWDRESANAFVGRGVTLHSMDTIFVEYLRLESTDSGLYYVAKVPQNVDLVYFRMTSHDESTSVFENPEHDFPTRIIYNRIGEDSLHARIEGERDGKPTGVDFVFWRVK